MSYLWTLIKGKLSFVNVLLSCAAIFFVIELSTHLDSNQWDLKTYYYAAKVAADGGNLYSVDISRAMDGGYVHQYLYPPLIARLLRPFAYVSLSTAKAIWYWIRVVLLVFLVGLWRRHFVPDVRTWVFYVMVMVGFSGAIYLDMKAGNVTIIEQLLIWSGFVCLMKRKIVWFCLLIVAASLFKGLPLLFLGLLFVLSIDRKWWYAIGSTTVLAAIQIIDYAMNPTWYREFLSKAIGWEERGPDFNPSVLSLLKDLRDAAIKSDWPAGAVQIGMYLFLAAIIGTVGLYAWRRTRVWLDCRPQATEWRDRVTLAVMSATLSYPLLVPRFKAYSFVLVIPAAALTINRFGTKLLIPLALFVAAMTAHPHFQIEPWAVDLFGWYYPTIVLAFFWVAWMRGVKHESVKLNLQTEAD